MVKGVSLSEGLPSQLPAIGLLIKEGSPESIRVALTILTISRSISLSPLPETSSITDA